MDPFMIVPGRPVADHEVSVSMPTHSNHRRNRHPPLLHATEWMKAMYHKENRPSSFKHDAETNGEGGEEAELPLKAVAKSLGPSLAEKRRGMIYTPQALRPDTSAGECEASETPFDSSLKQPNDSTAVEGEVDLCEDGEVSPRDVSRPLFTPFAGNQDEPALASQKRPDALRLCTPANRFCDVAGTPTVVFPKSLPVSTAENIDKTPQFPTGTSKGTRNLPMDEEKISTPGVQKARKPLPSPKKKLVNALPPSPQATKIVSTTTDNARGAGFPRIDYGPVGKHTALHSHRPSEEERKHSIWLGEGWKLWKSQKMMNGGREKGDGGKGSESRVGLKPLRRGVKGFFGCM